VIVEDRHTCGTSRVRLGLRSTRFVCDGTLGHAARNAAFQFHRIPHGVPNQAFGLRRGSNRPRTALLCTNWGSVPPCGGEARRCVPRQRDEESEDDLTTAAPGSEQHSMTVALNRILACRRPPRNTLSLTDDNGPLIRRMNGFHSGNERESVEDRPALLDRARRYRISFSGFQLSESSSEQSRLP